MIYKEITGMTVADKHAILMNCINFNDDKESSEKVQALVENETDGIADLVNLLKPEALTDPKAVNDISEATDTDAELIKELADSKNTTDEKSAELNLSPEEKQEFFSEVYYNLKPGLIADAWNRGGVQAFFSDKTLEGSADANEDTVEAIQLVKYIDPEVMESKDASDIAEVIAEATDGDKEILKDVVETVKEAVNFSNIRNTELFANTIAELGADAANIASENTAQILATLKQSAIEEQEKIVNGANVSIRPPLAQSQLEQSQTPTETDGISMGKLPSDVGNFIVDQTVQSIKPTLTERPDNTQPPTNPFVAFSNTNQMNETMRQMVEYNTMLNAPL